MCREQAGPSLLVVVPWLLAALCAAGCQEDVGRGHAKLPVLVWWEAGLPGLERDLAGHRRGPIASLGDLPPSLQVEWGGGEEFVGVCLSPSLGDIGEFVVYMAEEGAAPRELARVGVTELPMRWLGHLPVAHGDGNVTFASQPDRPGDAARAPCIDVTVAPPSARLSDLGTSQRAARFVFLDRSAAVEQGVWPVGPQMTFFDDRGTIVWTGVLPDGLYVLPNSYDFHSGEAGYHWLACNLVNATAEVGIEDSDLALLELSPAGSIGRDEMERLPRVPDLLSGCPAEGAYGFAAHPAFGTSHEHLFFYYELSVYAEPETLNAEAVAYRGPDGRVSLLDLHAAYHTSGLRAHDYLWSADAQGMLRERYNRDKTLWGLEGPSLDMRPSVSPDGTEVVYLKEGYVWTAGVATR